MLSSCSAFRFVSNSSAESFAHLTMEDMRLEEKVDEFFRLGIVPGDIVLMSYKDVQEFIRDFLAILKLGAAPVIVPPIETLDDTNRVVKAATTCCATICIADMDTYAKTLSLRPELCEAPYEAVQFYCSGSEACLLSSAALRREHTPDSKVKDFLFALINFDESMIRITTENFQKMLFSMVSRFALQSESIVFSSTPHFDIVGLCAGIIVPLFLSADVLLGISYREQCSPEGQERFGTASHNADPFRSAKEIISRWQPTHIVSNDTEVAENQNPMDLSHTEQIAVTKKTDVIMITADAISCLSTNDSHIRNIVSATYPHGLTTTPRLVQDCLSMHSSFVPGKSLCSFYDDDGTCVGEYSYSQFDKATTNLAWYIREQWNIGFQQRVILLFPPSLDFFVAFIACLKAGVIAVPVPPPTPDNLATGIPHFSAIVNDCDSQVVLTNSKYYWAVTLAKFAPGTKSVAWPKLSWRRVDRISAAPRQFQQWTSMNDIAFLQYTSGSTGQPKGVIVPHSALRVQVLSLQYEWDTTLASDSVVMSWIPHFHDMGLIGSFLAPLCAGANVHFFSPLTFMKRPATIVEVTSQVGGTIIAMPNFGFQYLVNKISQEIADSRPFESMKRMLSGAEPIRPHTVEAFCKMFHVSQDTILCSYGMAENVLCVSTSRYTGTVRNGKVCCGNRNPNPAFSSTIVRIVHPDTCKEMEEGLEGEIWIDSMSKAAGYWGKPDVSNDTFYAEMVGEPHRRYLRSGDYGFVQDGNLFVCGRLKNMIIIGGKNYYCQDIEQTVIDSFPEIIRPGCVIAFSVDNGEEEELILLAEVRDPDCPQDELLEQISLRVHEAHGVFVSDVALLRPRTIPKTTSGKLQHSKSKDFWINDRSKLDIVATTSSKLKEKSDILRHQISHMKEIDQCDHSAVVLQKIEEIAEELTGANGLTTEVASLEDLGGDSLKSAEFIRRLSATFGIQLEARNVLGNVNFDDLAEVIAKTVTEDSSNDLDTFPPIEHSTIEEHTEYRVSLNQSQMLTIYSMDQNSPAYNMPAGMWLSGSVKVEALCCALRDLQRRHAILRTTYRTCGSDDGFSQIIRPVDDHPLIFDEVDDEADALAIRAQDVQTGFKLFGGTPMRCRLLSVVSKDLYLLAFNCHHICFDGFSTAIMLREFSGLCQHHASGPNGSNVADIFDELPFQYVDFAKWQHGIFHHPVIVKQRSYWREQLREGALPVLEFPLDKPRPPVQTFNGSAAPFSIEAGLVNKLQAFGNSIGLNLFQCILSMWALLLCRHSGQDEVVVGVPYHGRDIKGTEDLIGYFVNMLSVRIEVPSERSCSPFFHSVRKVMLDAMSNSMLPFQSIVSELLPRGQRDAYRNAVFQTMLMWGAENGGWEDVADHQKGMFGSDVSVSTVGAAKSRTSKLDMSVLCHLTRTGCVGGVVEYNVDLFERTTIERLVNCSVILIGSALANPECNIWEVAVMPPGEVGRVLFEFNDSAKCFSRNVLLQDLFKTEAQLHPHAAAAEWKDSCLSYAELDQRSDGLALCLFNNGVRPNDIVGVQIDKSLDMPVAILGVLKCGGVFLPMDPTWPLGRRKFIVNDACCKILLVADNYVSDFTSFDGRILIMDRHSDLLEVDDCTTSSFCHMENNMNVPSSSIAFLLYTSGSTGKPKGVRIPHQVYTNALRSWRVEQFLTNHNFRFAVSASYVFDAFYMHLFLPLVILGGTCVFLENSMAVFDLDISQNLHALAEVPSIAAQVSIPPTVRVLFCTGEAVTTDVMNQLPPSCILHNDYGPTETFFVAQRLCSSLGEFGIRPGSIGHQFPNVYSFVVEPNTIQLQPMRVWGELLIGGIQVTHGYLNRDQLTADKYIANPWPVADPSGRGVLYRTGDKVRWYEDGELEFAGRMDFQVKLNGIRVELGEIENALRAQQGVVEVIVLLKDVGAAQPALVAYVQPALVAEKQSNVKLSLQQVLPTYMIPSIFVGIDEWPRTSSGKIDRKRLPAAVNQKSNVEIVAPRNEIENEIRNIFAEVLRLEPEVISVHDEFHSLGGNSLSAIRLTRLIDQSEVLGSSCPIAVTDVLQRPTVVSLAELLFELHGDDSLQLGSRLPKITCEELQEGVEYRVSLNQSQMLTIHSMDENSPAYNMPAGMWLSGSVKVEALCSALRDLQQRHAILRTTYRTCGSGDGFSQITLPVDDHPLIVDEVDDKADALAIRAQDAQTGFKLFGGTPMRCRLLSVRSTDLHLFAFNCHHICFDGFSVAILLREFSGLCQHHASAPNCGNVADIFDELPFQYVDFAKWQRAVQDHPLMERQRLYWTTQLRQGHLPVLEFPVDKPRPPVQTSAGDAVSFVIPANVVKKLQASGQQIGLNSFQMMLSLWSLLLCRHSGQDEVVVGVPYHGRDQPGLQDLIGFFVNVLILCITVPQDAMLSSYLRSVRQTAIDAMTNAHLPFQSIANDLLRSMRRDRSRNAIFQTLFTWGAEGGWASASGVAFDNLFGADINVSQVIDVVRVASKAELRLACSIDDSHCISGEIEFSTDLFHRSTIQRLVTRLVELSSSNADYPHMSVWTLPIMSSSEYSSLLWEFNDSSACLPKDVFLYDLFSKQVHLRPGSFAVEWQGARMTYKELDEISDQLATQLKAHGVVANTVVVLQLEKSLDMAVAIMGVIKSGGAFLPMDPSWPLERRQFIVRDADCCHLVVSDANCAQFSWFDGFCFSVSNSISHHSLVCSEPVQRHQTTLAPSDLACIIYTSGSSGQPKGVGLSHENMVNYLHVWSSSVNACAGTRFAVSANYVFSGMYAEFFGGLCFGGELVLLNSAVDVAESGILDINVVHSVPSVLGLIALPQSVCTVVSGGEAITQNIFEMLRAGIRLINSYGPTEATIAMAVKEYHSLADVVSCPASIGHPSFCTVCFVICPITMEMVPIGVWGELLVGGSQVSQGYLNRPELTAEKFIQNPFSDADPSGHCVLYRTGDKVRWRPDGSLEFGGRLDSQVKLRGQRIELGEIECVLRSQDDIQEAVVLLRDDIGSESILVAYVLPPQVGDNYKDLKRRLSQVLPSYMIPLLFHGMDDWPRTSTGKISRKELPVPINSTSSVDFIGPRNGIEREVRKVFAIVLGLNPEDISVHDDFHSLGGHSLAAIRLARQLEQSDVFCHSGSVMVNDILQRPTVAQLADQFINIDFDGSIEFTTDSRLPKILSEQLEEGIEYPASLNQSQMLTVHSLDENSPAYNMPNAMWVTGAVHKEALRSALRDLQQRHAILRTTYRTCDSDDGFSQVILPVDDHQLIFDEVDDEADALAIRAQDAQTGFKLFGGTPMRCRLISVVSTDLHLFAFNCHHICFDGFSTAVFLREFSSLCKHHVVGPNGCNVADIFDELPFQYADFARWQHGIFHHPVIDRQRSYWREQLREGALAVLEFPLDKPRPPVQTFNGSAVPFSIEADLVNKLNAFNNGIGLNLFQCILSMWALLLCRHSGQDEVVVGVTYHGREIAGTEELIGYFVNMLAARIEVPQDRSVSTFFQSAKTVIQDAMGNSLLPFQSIVNELLPSVQGDASRNAIFQTLLAWGDDGGWGSATDLSDGAFGIDVTVSEVDKPEARTAKVDLSLLCNLDSKGCISGLVEFNVDLFDRRTIDHLATRLACLAESVVDNIDSNIWVLTMTSSDERGRVLFEFNDTAKSFSRDVCLHDLFKLQAKRNPNAVALEWQGSQLTYAELDSRSDVFAAKLRSSGVVPNTVVALLIDKSLDMAVLILGVLKSGGAFLPLDPSWPLERRQFIVRDADCCHLVADDQYLFDCCWFDGCLLSSHLSYLSAEHALSKSKRLHDFDSASQLAWIIYTSGSTGTPKGVVVPHSCVVNYIQSWSALFSSRRIAVHMNYAFDYMYSDFFGCLSSGGTVVFLRNVFELDSLPGCNVEMVSGVTSVVAAMDLPHCIRTVSVGGEFIGPHAANLLRNGVRVANVFGPTEATIVMAVKDYHSFSDFEVCPTSVGRPMLGTTCYVTNPVTLELREVAVYGELFIGGPQVTQGYLNHSALTSESFIPNPWLETDPSGRGIVYRTGDKVRWRWDGELEFAGRVDLQIKLRGNRIEVGEIEMVLCSLSYVDEAVVLLRKDVGNEPALVAYLYPALGDEDISNIKQHLSVSLPSYMMPSFFVSVDKWPRTSSGKIDRKLLPAPDYKFVNGDIVEPQNEMEAAIRGVFSQILNLDPQDVSVNASFFSLGGNSLSAIRLVTRLQRSDIIFHDLTVSDVLKHTTAARLAQHVESSRGQLSSHVPRIRVLPVQEDMDYVASWNQLMTSQWQEKTEHSINVGFSMWLRGEISVTALQSAMRGLLRRHPALRTTLSQRQDGEIVQVVRSDTAIDSCVLVVDVDDEDDAMNKAFEDVSAHFQLFGGDVIRCHLFRLNSTVHLFHVTVHHISFDGLSVAVFMQDLKILYANYLLHPEDEGNIYKNLPELPMQYVDFSRWQRELHDHPEVEKQRLWWREHLRQGRLPVLELPNCVLAAHQLTTTSSEPVTVQIPSRLGKHLQSLALEHGCNLFQLMFASWALLLCRESGQEEVCLGYMYHGRDAVGLDKLIGFFANPLCIRASMPQDETFVAHIQHVKSTIVDAITNAKWPMQVLGSNQTFPHLDREWSAHALFQSIFLWVPRGDWIGHATDQNDIFGPDVLVEPVNVRRADNLGVVWPLEFHGHPTSDGGVFATIKFDGNMFERNEIKRLADDFIAILSSAASDPNQPL